MKILFYFILVFTSMNSYAQYWAEMNYRLLQQREVTVRNISQEPLHCQLRVFNEKAFFEINPTKRQRFRFREDVQIHNLSLYCKPIEKVTKVKPWIKQPYVNNNRPYISIFK